MKKILLLPILLVIIFLLCSCGSSAYPASVAATTLPVYEFTQRLCTGTDITVTRLVTESVSCLHDYTLQVDQMRAIESAKLTVISGGGLEEFLEDALGNAQRICDASEGLTLMEGKHHDHDHEHEHAHEDAHVHAEDPHIWLSPANAKIMAHNICHSLSYTFPEYADSFEANLSGLFAELDLLQTYGEQALSDLSCRKLITFHDGFAYFAESFGLEIIHTVEEESGSEAPASTLIGLIELVREHDLPAMFTETNGSAAAASIIAAETGVQCFALDMAMAGDSYFEAMYHNIDTIKEALQ